MDLFDKRWNLRIVALLYENKGSRFVVLKQSLGTNADSLSRCLEHLSVNGWVQRNPGYGHPLRPEYILTAKGHVVAPHCSSLVKLVDRLNVADTVYRKWSIPLLVTMESGFDRFSGLKESLSISPRALTQSLERLSSADLICRQKVYRLTRSGSQVANIGARIAANFDQPGL